MALIPSVSYGIAIAAANVEVSSNRRIVVLEDQFPSNVYSWRELSRATGAVLTTVPAPENSDWTKALLGVLDERTDVVAINRELGAFIDAQGWKARYPDLRFVHAGELVQQAEVLGNVGVAFAVCLLSIFFVLVLLFNSFSQPLLIFLDLPSASPG